MRLRRKRGEDGAPKQPEQPRAGTPSEGALRGEVTHSSWDRDGGKPPLMNRLKQFALHEGEKSSRRGAWLVVFVRGFVHAL